MVHSDALVDEITNEFATWSGVRIERRPDGAVAVRYEHAELGGLFPGRSVAEIPFLGTEHDELIDHGNAEPAQTTLESSGVSHEVLGPPDVMAVLYLFDRRYREVRGDDVPYSPQDPA